jgi:hypothetical protein
MFSGHRSGHDLLHALKLQLHLAILLYQTLDLTNVQ